MNKHKYLMHKVLSFVFASVLLCMNTIPAYASSNTTSVTNQGRIGAVDVELHQSFPAEQTAVIPGQTVSIESSVENKGQAAWIRVKLEYPTSDNALHELDDSLVTFADGAWKKIGAYYYLTDALDKSKTVPFTKALTFPYEWDGEMANTAVGMVFTVEAIQQKNFDPDFKSDDPWHGAVIEAFDSDGYEIKDEGTEKFSIVYKGGSEGMVRVGEDFFANWGDLMPGDELDGTAVIENRMNLPVEMYFDMKNSGDKDLLDKIKLTITNDKDVIFDGPLSGTLKSNLLLKKYQKNEKSELHYHLSVPAELNNASALKDFKVVWTFTAKEIQPKKTPGKTPDKTPNETPEKTPSKTPSITEVVKTGEYDVLIGICGVGIAAGTAGILYWRKRKGAK